MVTAAQTLGEVSEEGLLRSIFPFFAAQPGTVVGPGDDAAVLACSGQVVATTDSMVRGRDWLDEWSSAADVGAKLLTQNLADVAAMGGTPTSILVTLVADPATPAGLGGRVRPQPRRGRRARRGGRRRWRPVLGAGRRADGVDHRPRRPRGPRAGAAQRRPAR